jgi:Zn-dependent protease with chaperone function
MQRAAIMVTPSPAEVPLRVALLITGVALWILIVVSLVGLLYGILLGIFFFVAHMSLIAHVRGSSIKLGPDQMPEIYARVVELSQRIGLNKVPDVYLRQSGGVLNAFATRFGRARFIVLFSELVHACGDNVNALDFIIAHELGHLHRGHLNLRWLIGPAFFIPFLGSAYSRACEYTCDRYGFQASDKGDLGLDGLCILAAGPQFAAAVNRRAFAAQDRDLNTAFMKLGEWFATHPPLALRISALAPYLRRDGASSFAASLGALAIAALVIIVPIGAGGWFIRAGINDMAERMAAADKNSRQPADYTSYPTPSRPGDRGRPVR